LPPMEEHANVAAAERRDAYARSNRTSRGLFFAVVLLILGAFGYYGYQNRAAGDSNGGAAPATAQGENREPAAEAPRTAAAPASDASAIATQQMIERYLGTRAGVSPQRSVQ